MKNVNTLIKTFFGYFTETIMICRVNKCKGLSDKGATSLSTPFIYNTYMFPAQVITPAIS